MIEIQVCSKEGLPPFSKGDNYETAKIHWQSFKIFSRITWPILTNLGTKHPKVKVTEDKDLNLCKILDPKVTLSTIRSD